jgi:hypothetical protein
MVRILAGEDVDPETFAWERIAYADIARLREQLVGEIAPATVNRYGAALRGVLREVWALGLVDGDTRDRLLHGFRNARVGRLQVSGQASNDDIRGALVAGSVEVAKAALLVAVSVQRQHNRRTTSDSIAERRKTGALRGILPW